MMTARAMSFAWDQNVSPSAKLLLLYIGDNYGEEQFSITDVENSAPEKTGITRAAIRSMWPELYANMCIYQIGGAMHVLYLPELQPGYDPIPGPKRHRAPGLLYLLKSEGYYKIGITRQGIEKRLIQIQGGVPYPVEIVKTYRVGDPESVEMHLHTRLSDRRKNGEWFDLVQDDIDYIDLVCGES